MYMYMYTTRVYMDSVQCTYQEGDVKPAQPVERVSHILHLPPDLFLPTSVMLLETVS